MKGKIMDHTIPHPDLYGVPAETTEFNGMPYRLLGKSGLRVSNVGLGTWKVGFPETGDGARVDEKTAFKIFDRAIELGVTFWDTANRYNNAAGNSERVIGRWFKNNPDQRRNVILATKMGGGMDGVTPNHSNLGRINILESVYASLARLQLEYVDVLYFHGPDPVTPVEESLAAVEDLISRDLVRYFAVSNHTVQQLIAYQTAERLLSPRCRILAVQNQFDIIQGENSNYAGVFDFCVKNGISFIAWSPLARGLISDRYLDPSRIVQGDRLYDEKLMKWCENKTVMAKIHQLTNLAKEWGIETTQLALAYMLTLPAMGPVIPSATSVKQLESNAEAGKITLNPEQCARVKAILSRN